MVDLGGKEEGSLGKVKEGEEIECGLELEDEEIDESDAPPPTVPRMATNISIKRYALGDYSSSEDEGTETNVEL